MSARPLREVSTVALLVLAACGGKTGGGSPEGGAPSPDDGGTCVDIDPATYDRSCKQASDCVNIASGHLCTDLCMCDSASINASGQARYRAATDGLGSTPFCSCPSEGDPVCVAGRCMFQSFDSNAGDAGPACVDVELQNFVLSCHTESDCVVVSAGLLCAGQCACSNSAISVSDEALYDAEVSPVKPGACPCAQPLPGALRCVQGQCAYCSGALGEPPGCSDAGSP
jgi:hypothetical protein